MIRLEFGVIISNSANNNTAKSPKTQRRNFVPAKRPQKPLLKSEQNAPLPQAVLVLERETKQKKKSIERERESQVMHM